jgi:hypothetical protein
MRVAVGSIGKEVVSNCHSLNREQRPCSSRGVWDCQIDWEWALRTGCIAAPKNADAALTGTNGERPYTT